MSARLPLWFGFHIGHRDFDLNASHLFERLKSITVIKNGFWLFSTFWHCPNIWYASFWPFQLDKGMSAKVKWPKEPKRFWLSQVGGEAGHLTKLAPFWIESSKLQLIAGYCFHWSPCNTIHCVWLLPAQFHLAINAGHIIYTSRQHGYWPDNGLNITILNSYILNF